MRSCGCALLQRQIIRSSNTEIFCPEVSRVQSKRPRTATSAFCQLQWKIAAASGHCHNSPFGQEEAQLEKFVSPMFFYLSPSQAGSRDLHGRGSFGDEESFFVLGFEGSRSLRRVKVEEEASKIRSFPSAPKMKGTSKPSKPSKPSKGQ